MDDLSVFLTARYDERQALAEKAWGSRWRVVEGQRVTAEGVSGVQANVAVASGAESVLPHIAANDPQYALDDIAAKREILDEHPLGRDHPNGPFYCLECGAARLGPCLTVRFLGRPFADHPDYREEWRP